MKQDGKKSQKRVQFELAAGAGSEVFVAGSFNDWDPKATKLVCKNGDGKCAVSVPLAPGTYEYKFVVNSQWQLDPNNPAFRPNGMGTLNSVVTV